MSIYFHCMIWEHKRKASHKVMRFLFIPEDFCTEEVHINTKADPPILFSCNIDEVQFLNFESTSQIPQVTICAIDTTRKAYRPFCSCVFFAQDIHMLQSSRLSQQSGALIVKYNQKKECIFFCLLLF